MEKSTLYEPLLVETAWEICNKVGGIYTVIQSKAPYITERWGDNYCTIGPMLSDRLPIEFEPTEAFDDPFGKAIVQMRNDGFEIYYGDWLIAGKPKVVLMPLQQANAKMHLIKQEYYQNHGLPFNGDPLVDKVAAFGWLTFQYLKRLAKPEVTDKPIIAHFHEWMASMPIMEIKRQQLRMATVFTTHATSLGRYMAMNDLNFYKKLHNINWAQEMKRYAIEPQVMIERLSAANADVMSTVSRVTDNECKYLLDRESDIILPNGMSITRFIATHEFQNMHLAYKEKIHEFVMGHFFNNYTFDLDNTIYFFTSGRYEFVNKGYDLTLEALRRLNLRMQKAKLGKTVVMFFVTKRPYHTINPSVLEMRSLMGEIKETCDEIVRQLQKKLFYRAAQEGDYNLPDLNELVDDYWRFRFRKTIQSWKSNHLPIIVTHNLKDDSHDEILQYMRNAHLFNLADDPVKIIYHPDFIDSTNPLFKLDYQQFVRGCHLGIFPSYYEPWGYTPVECLAFGIPTVTSDLAGFGDFAKQNLKSVDENGIYVVRRRNQTFDEAAEELTDYLFDFVKLSRRERIMQRNNVENVAETFSWRNLGRYYLEAYKLAIERMPK